MDKEYYQGQYDMITDLTKKSLHEKLGYHKPGCLPDSYPGSNEYAAIAASAMASAQKAPSQQKKALYDIAKKCNSAIKQLDHIDGIEKELKAAILKFTMK